MRRKTLWPVLVGCCLVVALAVSACGSSSGSSGGGAGGGSGKSGPYKVVYNSAFVGNDSQPQAENIVNYVAKHDAPYNKEIKFSVVHASAPAVPDQIASLQSVVRSKPAGLIVFPFSETALNGVITQACNAGIKVVAEDLTVTAPCAYNRTYDVTGVGHDQAAWMCKVLNGHGSVLIDRGQPGGSVGGEEVRSRVDYLKSNCPGVTIAGYYTGFYTPGKELVAVSNALAAHPQVTGILSDYSCSATLQAEKKAGLKSLPVACFAVNGNATACVAAKVNCLLYSDPTTEYAEAMQEMLGLLKGKTYAKNIAVKQPTFVVAPVAFAHTLPVETLKAGKNYFPGQPATLVLPVGTKQFPITPAVALGQQK